MAGIVQNNPWTYNPYSAQSILGPGSATPGGFGWPQGAGQVQLVPQQIQQLQQLLQFIPQQIQQLQQLIQFLPQHVAQLVAQTLIQPQGPLGYGVPGAGFPFQSIQTGNTPFPVGQAGYVM